MKKWFFAIALSIFSLIMIIKQFSQVEVREKAAKSPKSKVDAGRILRESPPKAPASLAQVAQKIPLSQRLGSGVAINIGPKSYRVHEGKLALTSAQARRLNLPIEGRMGDWVIVDERDVPADEISYPLLEREGSSVLGVFRGVIKAQSLNPLTLADIAHCPGRILSNMPKIKIALIELTSSATPSELKTCLSETRLFNRLEWEILDQPRRNR